MNEVLPPPPPPRGGDSCWKWGAIGCGVGCLALIIVSAILGFFVWPTISTAVRGSVKAVQQAQACQPEMLRVWKAVEKYHKDKGTYPSSLHDLVPAYIATEAELRFSGIPEGPEFTYRKPEADSSGSAVMLEYSIPVAMGSAVPQKMYQVITISKDGTPELQQRQEFPPGYRRRRNPFGGGE